MKSDMSVEYVDHMGSDLSVVNAARVSFNKRKDVMDADDSKLIRYLAEHDHWSPFAHASISFRIKAPIFVARQLVKHQIGLSWNEVSRRYVSTEPEFYVPPEWRSAPTDGAKQGSSEGDCLDHSACNWALDKLISYSEEAYDRLLELGAAPEMARMALPQNMMTEWIWTGTLFAFARVCRLRLDSHAQAETGEIAKKLSEICGQFFPVSWETLVKANLPDRRGIK